MSRLPLKAACAALLLALVVAQPAQAQQAQPRVLAVPAAAAWQHAATQIILPPRVAGLRRGEIRDSTAEELDVVADYDNAAEGVAGTVYVFRTQTPDAALWFDRALTAIQLRPGWGLEGAAPPAPTGFARPGAPLASGLRASLDVGTPEVRSTALAIAPLGDFLVKVRLSSARLDQAGLDALLTRFIEGLRWPAAAATGERAAVAIAPCPEPLRFRRARVVRSDASDVLMTLLSSAVVAQREGPPPVYCREPGASGHGVYRVEGSRDSYLLALGDAGVALSVGQALNLGALTGEGGGGGRRYSVTLLDRSATSALPSFNRLPPPDQAIALVFGNFGPVVSISTEDRPER